MAQHNVMRANLEDPERAHINWTRTDETLYQIVGTSFVCGDYYLSFNSFLYQGDFYIDHSVRFRNPGNGGGNMQYGYNAIAWLFSAFRKLYHHPHLPFPIPPAPAHNWVYRHLDERWGHIGVMVEEDGTILVVLVPYEGGMHAMKGEHSLLYTFPPATTPWPIYMELHGLLHAIKRDNQERPNFGGNHG